MLDLESKIVDTYHGFTVVKKFDGFSIQWEIICVFIVKEMDSMLIQPERKNKHFDYTFLEVLKQKKFILKSFLPERQSFEE